MTKSPEIVSLLDRLSTSIFGHTRSQCFQTKTCVVCGKSAIEFDDWLSRKEYGISGMCQKCQDVTFFGE